MSRGRAVLNWFGNGIETAASYVSIRAIKRGPRYKGAGDLIDNADLKRGPLATAVVPRNMMVMPLAKSTTPQLIGMLLIANVMRPGPLAAHRGSLVQLTFLTATAFARPPGHDWTSPTPRRPSPGPQSYGTR